MSTDLQFAVWFAEQQGKEMVRLRTVAKPSKKLDGTVVTNVDQQINTAFIAAVKRREGNAASVRGEEGSRTVRGAKRIWIIDPIGGTHEYIDAAVPDYQRTSSLGISLFVDGKLTLAVVRNPFRRETFATTTGIATTLNGRVVRCATTAVQRGVAYDYSHWTGARFDVRGLEQKLGKPRGVRSALYRACEVAAGRSAFAVSPADTPHNTAPGVLLVLNAGGSVTDLRGRTINWSNLRKGLLYAARGSHGSALRAIDALS